MNLKGIKNLFKCKKCKTKKVTVEDFMNEHVQKTGTYYPINISKEMLEELMKQFPKDEHPLIVENDGKLMLTDSEGKSVKVNIPLLTIVPIPYIPVEDIDMKKYYEENFGGAKEKKQIKSLDDIEGIKINVPTINICPIPNLPKEEIDKADKEFNNLIKNIIQ